MSFKREFEKFERDRAARWELGRALHGGGPFVGNPGDEADEEFLDAVNYIEEVRTQTITAGHGPNLDELDALIRETRTLGIRLRLALRAPWVAEASEGA